MNKYLILLGIVLLVFGCTKSSEKRSVTRVADYDQYLNTTWDSTSRQAISAKEFWSARLRPDSSGVGDLAPLASAYEQLFAVSGNAGYLLDAERLYQKGLELSAQDKDGFARALARNYISQHRFKEAYELLLETYSGPSNKRETELVLFDAAMEVGEYEKAYEFLEKVKDFSDYHYLIRLSKWSDYRGDLDNAIKYLEKAKAIAESRDSRLLRIWTYSNLADYYGHAGRTKDSYAHYLLTLKLQPDNAYAKKGIVWVLYSEENNTSEAHRILDSIMKRHKLPDYHLLKSEMYAYEGNNDKAEKFENNFISMVKSGSYGAMYNTYLIEHYSETDPQQALQLAKEELQNRPTPEIYHLLALAQLNNGMKDEALRTIEEKVQNKTFEPMALYHSALVYKAHGMTEKLAEIKSELKDAAYELGPLLFKKIEAL